MMPEPPELPELPKGWYRGHGISRYNKGGCRCVVCTEANRLAGIQNRRKRGVLPREEYLAAVKARKVHGRIGTYQRGCRCDECREIARIRRKYYRSQRAKAPGRTITTANEPLKRGTLKLDGHRVCLYHSVRAHETFDDAAEQLFSILRLAQQNFPGQRRALYLDIEGHRNDAGGFDHDMYELQRHFVMGMLADWLTEVHMPLANFVKDTQSDNVPPQLIIQASELEFD